MLENDSNIDYVTPYFKTIHGDTVALSTILHVKLNNISDTTMLKTYCSTNNLSIVKQDEFMPLWFILSVNTDAIKSSLEFANQLYEEGAVQYAEPDFVGSTKSSNVNITDTYWSDQWGLNNTGQYGGTSGVDIKAREAWAITTGQNIKVAVIDQGIQLDHPDLQNNIYSSGYDAITESQSLLRGDHGNACAGIYWSCC